MQCRICTNVGFEFCLNIFHSYCWVWTWHKMQERPLQETITITTTHPPPPPPHIHIYAFTALSDEHFLFISFRCIFSPAIFFHCPLMHICNGALDVRWTKHMHAFYVIATLDNMNYEYIYMLKFKNVHVYVYTGLSASSSNQQEKHKYVPLSLKVANK